MKGTRKVFLWLRRNLIFIVAAFEAINVAFMLATPATGPRFEAKASLSALQNPLPFLRNLATPIPYMWKYFGPYLLVAIKTSTFWFYFLEYVVLLLALPHFVAYILNLEAPEYVPVTASLSRLGLLWVFGDFDVVGKFMNYLSRDILYLNSILVVALEVLYVMFFCETCRLKLASTSGGAATESTERSCAVTETEPPGKHARAAEHTKRE
jgi:hypothetical protein